MAFVPEKNNMIGQWMKGIKEEKATATGAIVRFRNLDELNIGERAARVGCNMGSVGPIPSATPPSHHLGTSPLLSPGTSCTSKRGSVYGG